MAQLQDWIQKRHVFKRDLTIYVYNMALILGFIVNMIGQGGLLYDLLMSKRIFISMINKTFI